MVKTDKARLNVYIDPEIHAKAKSWSKKSGASISALVNTLLRSVFDENLKASSLSEFKDSMIDTMVTGMAQDMTESGKQNLDIEKIKQEIKDMVLQELNKEKK